MDVPADALPAAGELVEEPATPDQQTTPAHTKQPGWYVELGFLAGSHVVRVDGAVHGRVTWARASVKIIASTFRTRLFESMSKTIASKFILSAR